MNPPPRGPLLHARPPRHAAAVLGGLVLCLAVPAAAGAAPSKDPAVVARVNGKPILRRDFDLAVQLQFRGRAPGVGLGELRAARERILEALIDGELLYQKAARNGREPAAAEVAAEMKRLRDGFGSEEEFAATLRDNGVPEAEFREQVRRSLVVDRFVEREVVGPVEVPDSELRQYYDQNPRDMLRPERVRFSQILARAPADEPGGRAAARRKIEAILKELRAGREFADLARRHSDGPGKERGGEAGFLVRGTGLPALERVLFSLQPGQTSDIVETRLGFHLVRVLERQPEGPIPFEEAKEAIRARLAARARDARLRAYVDGLRAGARIERLEPAVAGPAPRP